MNSLAIPLIFAPVLAIAGCASGVNIDDSVPRAAVAPLPAPQSAGSGETSASETTTIGDPLPEGQAEESDEERISKNGSDGFPNLNIQPEAATDQLSDGEKNANIARLKAAKANQARQGAGRKANAAEAQRLKRLARTHAGNALKEIEETDDDE